MSQAEAADFAGVSCWYLQRIERLDFSFPKAAETVSLIADSFELSIDKIMPPDAAGQSFGHTITATGEMGLEALDSVSKKHLLTNRTPVDEIEEKELSEQVLRAISRLPFRRREVLKLRFGIGGDRPMTYEEIGRAFSVTRERVRQIEQHGLRNLMFNGELMNYCGRNPMNLLAEPVKDLSQDKEDTA